MKHLLKIFLLLSILSIPQQSMGHGYGHINHDHSEEISSYVGENPVITQTITYSYLTVLSIFNILEIYGSGQAAMNPEVNTFVRAWYATEMLFHGINALHYIVDLSKVMEIQHSLQKQIEDYLGDTWVSSTLYTFNSAAAVAALHVFEKRDNALSQSVDMVDMFLHLADAGYYANSYFFAAIPPIVAGVFWLQKILRSIYVPPFLG